MPEPSVSCARGGAARGLGARGLLVPGLRGRFQRAGREQRGSLGMKWSLRFGWRFQEFGCCGGASRAGSSATRQRFCLKNKEPPCLGVFSLGTKSLQKALEESMGLSLAVPQGSSSASSRERNCLIS